MKHYYIFVFSLIMFFASLSFCIPVAYASYHFGTFTGRPPIHVLGSATASPSGLSPDALKSAYHLPKTGGSGTIAVVGAYIDPTIASDLVVFNKQFGLADCTIKNGCLTVHPMSTTLGTNSGWSMETSLDVEWSHAIAPQAKILLVEAKTASGANLLSALDYAVAQSGVVAVSMSWGGAEFPEEVGLDSHFIVGKNKNITFFASAGDNGSGASWPASSPYVVGVGGTRLSISETGSVISETAWNGSGGGVSAYETEPNYQTTYNIPRAGGMRAIPDVSYDADPVSGVSVYYSGKVGVTKGWYVVGGTSAGAPQWAGIKALGLSADNQKFYADKLSSSPLQFFRDVRSGINGDCGYVCTARTHYDYVTGLGSPMTVKF